MLFFLNFIMNSYNYINTQPAACTTVIFISVLFKLGREQVNQCKPLRSCSIIDLDLYFFVYGLLCRFWLQYLSTIFVKDYNLQFWILPVFYLYKAFIIFDYTYMKNIGRCRSGMCIPIFIFNHLFSIFNLSLYIYVFQYNTSSKRGKTSQLVEWMKLRTREDQPTS